MARMPRRFTSFWKLASLVCLDQQESNGILPSFSWTKMGRSLRDTEHRQLQCQLRSLTPSLSFSLPHQTSAYFLMDWCFLRLCRRTSRRPLRNKISCPLVSSHPSSTCRNRHSQKYSIVATFRRLCLFVVKICIMPSFSPSCSLHSCK